MSDTAKVDTNISRAIDDQKTNKACVPENLKSAFIGSTLPPCTPPSNAGFKPGESIVAVGMYSKPEMERVQVLLNQTVRAGDNLIKDGEGGVSSRTEAAMTHFARLYNIDHPIKPIDRVKKEECEHPTNSKDPANKKDCEHRTRLLDPANKENFMAALEDAAKRGTYRIEK